MKNTIKSPAKQEILTLEKSSRIPLTTKNYDLFVPLNGNRVIDENHVLRLIHSIQIHGNKSTITVREISKNGARYFEVVDGQHRLEALKALKMAVDFDIREINNRAMIALNESQKNWKLEDYLNFGIKDGLHDYGLLYNYKQKSGIALGVLIELFGKDTTGSHEGARKYKGDLFKALIWKIKDREKGEKLLEMLIDFYKTYQVKHYHHQRFVMAFSRVSKHPDYNHQRMMRQLAKSKGLLKKQLTTIDYIKNFEDVYNFDLPNSEKVIFPKGSEKEEE